MDAVRADTMQTKQPTVSGDVLQTILHARQQYPDTDQRNYYPIVKQGIKYINRCRNTEYDAAAVGVTIIAFYENNIPVGAVSPVQTII